MYAFFRISCSISLCLAVLACDRKVPSHTAAFQVDLPSQQVGATSTQILTRVMVNVTGEGIQHPIVGIFEHHCHECPGSTGLTGPFELFVPKGNGRLVQVLAIYENTTLETMSFNYGDQLVDLSGDKEIEVEVLALSSSSREGQISGRYLTTATSGPTGKAAAYYKPPGKPKMIVDFSEIINGWFDFHILDDVPLTYVMEPSGQILFADVSLSSMPALVSDRVMQVAVPDQTYNVHATHNGSNFIVDESRDYHGPDEVFLGWFGPGATASHYACYTGFDWASILYRVIDHDNSGGNTAGDALERICQDSSCTNTMYFFGSTVDNTQLSRIAGGKDKSGFCSNPADKFLTKLHFEETYFDQERNSHSGFMGPFRIIPPLTSEDHPGYLSGTYSVTGKQMTLNWDLLPGVVDGANGIHGVAVFYRSGMASWSDLEMYRMNEGYDCHRAAAEMSHAGTTGTNSLVINNLHHSQVNSTGVMVCPYRDDGGGRHYFSSAATRHFGDYPVGIQPLVALETNIKTDVTAPIDLNWAITGGTPPLNYAMVSGGGTVNGVTGVYTPTGAPGIARITDADGATVDLNITPVAASTYFDFFSSFPPGFGLTRGGPAYHYDSDGILVTASANVPRWDYDPGDCLNPTQPRFCAPRGLLIEGVTTNEFAYSTAFDNAAWLNFAYDPDITPNATVAPDGTTTAYLIEDTNKNASNNDKLFYNNFTGHAAGTTLVFSVYVKANTSTIMGITMQEAGVSNSDLFVDLANVTTNNTSKPHGVEKLPNGWFRVWITHTKTTTNTMTAWIMPATSATSFSPTALGSIYVWGAQMEINKRKYPTSYVATSGSAMGRVADNLTTPGPAFFSNPFASTILLEYYNPGDHSTQMGTILNIDQSGGGGADYLRVKGGTSGGANMLVNQSSSSIVNQTLAPPSKGMGAEKLAMSFQPNQFQAAMNGFDKYTGNAYTPLTGIAYFSLGEGPSLTDQMDGNIRKLVYWPDVLSMTALQSLSY